MNKIFIKEIFLSVFIVLSSFFLSSPKVNADTYSFNIQQSQLDFVNNSLSTCITTVENFIDSNPSYNFTGDYIIVYLWGNYSVLFKTSISSTSKAWFLPNSNNNKYFAFNYAGGSFNVKADFNSSFTELNSISEQYYGNISSFYNTSIYYYSTFDIPFFETASNNFTFVFSDKSYNVTQDTSNYLPTIHNLYSMWYGDPILPPSPPSPEDNTPLLTDFITISINKLTLICDFITSSYIYLVPFVIIIFYFVILIFRRLK